MPDQSVPVVEQAPDDAPYLPALAGDGQSPAFLTRDAPLIDSLPERWIGYLANTIAQVEDGAPPITKSDVSVFVELCATYQLDPFAKEAWLAKSKRGKLLVMVGRDGLRKIAQRNGLHVDGDVVHAKDDFSICRTPDGNRTVAHAYGNPSQRGDIVGAWAECREGGPLGRPMGYFYAALGEYKPKNASEYSPWSKQTSVMILAAAERQAIRQGTPLGGLVAFGEHESAFGRVDDLTDVEGASAVLDAELRLPPAVHEIASRAKVLGYAPLANRAALAMAVDGQPEEFVRSWVASATRDLNRYALGKATDLVECGAAEPPDVEVVEHAPPTDDEQAAADELGVGIVSQGFLDDGPSRRAEPRPIDAAIAEADEAERIEALRKRANELLDEATVLDEAGDERAAEVRQEAEALMDQVDAAGPQEPEQGSLGL
jgi:hypothetical protein